MAGVNDAIRVVLQGIAIFLEILSWIIFADVLLSWILPQSRLKETLDMITDPILTPFRSLLQKMSKGRSIIDLSPTFALLVLFALSMIVSAISASI